VREDNKDERGAKTPVPLLRGSASRNIPAAIKDPSIPSPLARATASSACSAVISSAKISIISFPFVPILPQLRTRRTVPNRDHEAAEAPDPLLRVDPVQHQVVLDRRSQFVWPGCHQRQKVHRLLRFDRSSSILALRATPSDAYCKAQ
jgi:hypothetical protein